MFETKEKAIKKFDGNPEKGVSSFNGGRNKFLYIQV